MFEINQVANVFLLKYISGVGRKKQASDVNQIKIVLGWRQPSSKLNDTHREMAVK